MPVSMIYLTAAKREELLRIGRVLIEERLVACINVLGEMTSLFRWDGAIQEETEAAAIAKTSRDLVERVIARVRELHEYDCPCVVVWPIAQGNPEFLHWVDEETQENPG